MIKNVGMQQPNISTGSTQGLGTGVGGIQKNIKDADLFKNVLDKEISGNDFSKSGLEKLETKAQELLKFSSHALDRIQSRGIKMMKEDVEKLNEAVEKASKKGAKDALVVMGENAFIVSVKNKTVVTAVDKNALKENVFTNIDSTVFA